jgi:type IX secretion system PorP/SprF family membrane protein
MKKYIIVLAVLFSQVKLLAQDPNFSQYFASPMNFNPALLGNDMHKEYKINLLTRQKWWGENAKPFVTNAISVQKQITATTSQSNLMYVGVQMLNERSSDGVLTNSYFGTAINDKIKLAEYDFLSTSLSFAYSNRMVDLSVATFQTQFGSFGFVPSSVNYDPISLVSKKYFDLNAGVSFDHQGKDQLDYQFGLGLFHVNRPGQSVLNNDNYKLNIRTVLHGSLSYKLKNKDIVYAGINMQAQGQDRIFTIGGNYTRKFDELKNIYLTVGLWDRWGEAFYPYFGLKYNDIGIGISYDVPPTELRSRIGATNSMEATISWDLGKKK